LVEPEPGQQRDREKRERGGAVGRKRGRSVIRRIACLRDDHPRPACGRDASAGCDRASITADREGRAPKARMAARAWKRNEWMHDADRRATRRAHAKLVDASSTRAVHHGRLGTHVGGDPFGDFFDRIVGDREHDCICPAHGGGWNRSTDRPHLDARALPERSSKPISHSSAPDDEDIHSLLA
jgi:hypothetical protein